MNAEHATKGDDVTQQTQDKKGDYKAVFTAFNEWSLLNGESVHYGGWPVEKSIRFLAETPEGEAALRAFKGETPEKDDGGRAEAWDAVWETCESLGMNPRESGSGLGLVTTFIERKAALAVDRDSHKERADRAEKERLEALDEVHSWTSRTAQYQRVHERLVALLSQHGFHAGSLTDRVTAALKTLDSVKRERDEARTDLAAERAELAGQKPRTSGRDADADKIAGAFFDFASRYGNEPANSLVNHLLGQGYALGRLADAGKSAAASEAR